MPNQLLKASRLFEDQFYIDTFFIETKTRYDPSSLSFSPAANSIGITSTFSNSNEESFSETNLRGLLSSPRESTTKTTPHPFESRLVPQKEGEKATRVRKEEIEKEKK